jgi:hypothetical protein
MTDPALEPEKQPTPSEMAAGFAWIVGPLGCAWVGAYLVSRLFPDWSPYLQLASVAIPIAAALYGIGFWRRRNA